jgi:hypothetical protein
MPSTLIIPGVQVTTLFEPSPVLPGATGILGLVGIAERGPIVPTPVGTVTELTDAFGTATRYSMPEARGAFTNGVFKVYVARTQPGRGQRASLDLTDDDGDKKITLIARAEGQWGNTLAVQVTQVKTLSGQGIKYVNLEVFLSGESIETFKNLVMDEQSPDYFFDRINNQSRVLVAVDTQFQTGLPSTLAKTALANSDARAAFVVLKAGATDVVRVDAKRTGNGGNLSAVRVTEGQAGLALTGAANAPSVDIHARQAGTSGTGFRVSVVPAGPTTFNVVITPPAAAARTLGPFTSVDDVVNGLKSDPDVGAEARGIVPPSALAATPLGRRITIDVVTEGSDTGHYANLPDIAAVASISDPIVTFTVVGNATQLPDVVDGARLRGGRDPGPALFLTGDGSDQPLLEIVPTPGAPANLSVSVTRKVSTLDNATGVVSVTVFVDDQETETFSNATMDPEDLNYLPHLLESSALIRAHDLFVRTRSSNFPVNMGRPAFLKGGTSPLIDDYQAAVDRLESAEEVDLVIASVANQLNDAGVRAAHKAVVAHCTKMAEVARNRIGLGSVTVSEAKNIASIIDHANDVRSDYFILSTPAGTEAALAGLLSRQDYFESPTFKNILSLDGPAGTYTDSQLTQLINDNIAAINDKRKLGTIVVKGLLTSGRQINVQRTANKAVREVQAISNVYIGLLNNEGARNALRQQVIAMFLQMEKDGAIVPSTDGKDPSHKVDVYSSEADFANGIVRVDIAVRPVHAIDYIYATILVKN